MTDRPLTPEEIRQLIARGGKAGSARSGRDEYGLAEDLHELLDEEPPPTS